MDNITKAVQYYKNGFVCTQAVFAAFADQFGITEKQALLIGACFGSGMSKAEVCGACTGALMVLGMKYGQFDLNDTDSHAAQGAKLLSSLRSSKSVRVHISAGSCLTVISPQPKAKATHELTVCTALCAPKW